MDNECTDILVVGGGTAGCMAALAAAEGDLSVILVERENVVGGLAAFITDYWYGLEMGMFKERDKLAKNLESTIGDKGESKRLVNARKLAKSSVKVICGQPFEVLKNGDQAEGIIVQNEEKCITIEAKIIIDCTGDADIATLAGAPYNHGRKWDQLPSPYSYCVKTNKGILKPEGWVDVRDPVDISRALIDGRRKAWEITDKGQKPEVISFYNQLGIRTGRNIKGDYILTFKDIIKQKEFSDSVMLCFASYDSHSRIYANENNLAQIWCCVLGLYRLLMGAEIPYRCFLPQQVENILVASRAISLDHDAGMLFRMERDIQIAGEVAGQAALLAVQNKVAPRYLNIQELKKKLNERGIKNRLSALSSIKTTCRPSNYDGFAYPSQKMIQSKGNIGKEEGLEYLHTSGENDALAWWFSEEEDYFELLGTPGENKFLHNLYFYGGEEYIDPLKEIYDNSKGQKKTGAAFALALLEQKDGVEELINCIKRRDTKVVSGEFTHPRWIGAMLLLRKLRAVEAFDVIEKIIDLDTFPANIRNKEDRRLDNENSEGDMKTYNEWMNPANFEANVVLFALRYFDETLVKFNENQLSGLCKQLKKILKLEIGEEFYMNYQKNRVSIKWSIDTTAAGILVKCGHNIGKEILKSYMKDPRRYVRNAAMIRWKECVYQ